MRELKFRAWDKEDKKYYPLINLWFDSSLGKLCTAELWLSPKATEIADIPEQIELEQYTGLKDKNGKEIYEGDIVEKDGINYWIKWEDGCFVIWRGEKNISFVVGSHVSWCEVIGNIHENPELLEEE